MGFDRYLVDPASGHMLVSKIKPCMSKHEPIYGEAANGSLQQPLFLGSYFTWITVVILELIHAIKPRPLEGAHLLDQDQSGFAWNLVTLNNFADHTVLVPVTYLSSVCPINFRW